MSISSLLGFIVVPAVGFAVIYFPALTHFTLALISPYPKAEIARRMNAALVDLSLAVAAVLAYQRLDRVWVLAAGAVYLLFRDAVGGRSVGKLLLGLVVVNVATGAPATFRESIKRNLIFLLPGANLTAIVLEALTIQRDPQGCRLGDRIAQTQVIHGLGVREMAAVFHEWWGRVMLQSSQGRRRRKAATINRAARHETPLTRRPTRPGPWLAYMGRLKPASTYPLGLGAVEKT
jgi:hypothetical protein